MISKQDFDLVAKKAAGNFSDVLPLMISYKNYVQRAVLNMATQRELEDVKYGRFNQGMVDKLCKLAKNEWLLNSDAKSLYCAAIAVATIIKEYDWGTKYLIGNGVWEIGNKRQNA
ncbi:MAG: hypothetical protein K2M63_11020 [Muribaculaceae bacterium]|nr:hypothetical protein [Muribaculaceae bacterium]